MNFSRQKKNELFEQFKKVHGEKYDYSLVQYKNIKTKIKIICPVHGIFEQSPIHHKKGSGCILCSYDKTRKNFEDIKKKFDKIHNNKYDYSISVYKNMKTKIKIICPFHGVFEQTPKKSH